MRNAAPRRHQVFTAVANRPSFSWAADELYLTQTAVSMQVQALEDLAGVALCRPPEKSALVTRWGNYGLRWIDQKRLRK